MNRNLNLGIWLAVFLLGCLLSNYCAHGLVWAQSEAASAKVPEVESKADERVDQIFAGYAKPKSPGCALGVIQIGNFVYRKGYGMGSLELGVPLSSRSVFYMGSVSKQFTAASIVLAAEQGFLSLDDNVRKYVPELPDYGQPITIREMLHHSSGLPDVLSLLGISGRSLGDVYSTAELMDLIVRQKALNFNSGDEYLYSNTNYFLLAEVVKRATKKPLPEFAAENIFKPLGMTHTRFYDDHTLVVPGRVAAYRPGKNGEFLVDWSTNYDIIGGGGLMSSVNDLLLWDRNFYENKLGKGTLVKEMQTPGVLNNGKQNNYALGLMMSTYRGLPIVEHDGANFGYRTDILRFPQQRFTVVDLCNSSSAEPDSLTRKVADIYLEKILQPARAPATLAASGSDPAMFVGKYFESRTHYLASFTVANGHLMLEDHVLESIGPNEFEDPIIGGTITFSSSTAAMKGTVTYNNEITFAGTRINDLYLDDAALAAYAGTYKSEELDATYKLAVEKGSLMLTIGWNPPIKLVPIVQNEFAGGGMTLVFHRDNAGYISGLSIFAGWDGSVRNENFERLN
jgi:CubicO group peptidase (beta-lactamase class C family)